MAGGLGSLVYIPFAEGGARRFSAFVMGDGALDRRGGDSAPYALMPLGILFSFRRGIVEPERSVISIGSSSDKASRRPGVTAGAVAIYYVRAGLSGGVLGLVLYLRRSISETRCGGCAPYTSQADGGDSAARDAVGSQGLGATHQASFVVGACGLRAAALLRRSQWSADSLLEILASRSSSGGCPIAAGRLVRRLCRVSQGLRAPSSGRGIQFTAARASRLQVCNHRSAPGIPPTPRRPCQNLSHARTRSPLHCSCTRSPCSLARSKLRQSATANAAQACFPPAGSAARSIDSVRTAAVARMSLTVLRAL